MAAEFDVVRRPSLKETAAQGWLSALVHRLIDPFRRGRIPEQHPVMGFYTDTSVCIGCKACEVACKQWNQLPADGFQFTGDSYDNTGELSAGSWRHVKFIEQFADVMPPKANGRVALDVIPKPELPATNRWLMMSDVCKHCAAAPCQLACPTGAIIYNEFGNVYIQPDICNGCAYCVAACPFGVVTRSEVSGHARKCTLCYDRQKDGLVPACAKACPTASIQFGPLDELKEKAKKRVEDLHKRGNSKAHLYGDTATETYTELHSFYLLLDQPEVYGLPNDPMNPWVHIRGDYLRTAIVGLVTLGVLLAIVVLRGG
jgi:formate dehydrogenase iron-sulfur subunit